MFFFAILISLLFFTPSHQHTLDRSHRILKRATISNFKGIPKFDVLKSDEKRDVYYCEQSIAVRDSGPNNEIRRCEVLEVYEEQKLKEVLQNLTSLFNVEPQKVNMTTMISIMNECDSLDNISIEEGDSGDKNFLMFPEEDLPKKDHPNSIFNGIFPGTKWCGAGDIADSYHDLHGIRNVDRCCRAHDLCPIKVYKHDNRYNITNTASYTKSHCTCDENFYDCLKRDKGWSAKIIGYLYFYIGAPDCIQGFPGENLQLVKPTRKW